MPCIDGRDVEDRAYALANIGKVEALLCSACRQLELTGYDFGLNPALDEWWYNHKVEDITKQENKVISTLNSMRNIPLTQQQINALRVIGLLK